MDQKPRKKAGSRGTRARARTAERLRRLNRELRTANLALAAQAAAADASERRLRERQGLFEATMELLPDVIVVYGRDRRILYANPAAAGLGQRPLPDIVGRRDEELFPPEITDQFLPRLELALRSGARQTFEVSAGPEEDRRSYFVSYLPVRGPGGAVEHVVGLTRDVTVQKRVELILRERERWYRELAEQMPQLVWSCAADGRCDYLSRQWVEYTGVAEARHQGEGWIEAIHPDDRPTAASAWAQALRGGLYDVLYRLRRHDGAYRWFRARAAVLRDATGAAARWFGSSTDVDDQVRAQQALQEADRRKDDFLATLGHELRNPLAPMRYALATLARAGGLDEPAGRARGALERQVNHLGRIVDDLLDVSRVTRGKIQLRRERVALPALVRAAIEDHAPLLAEAGLAVRLELPEVPLPVDGDPARLAQVLGNLLQNAGKFTDRGGAITVRLAAAGREAVLSVTDTGVGLEAELRERLFEPFAQGRQSLARTGGGLGLGLALVKGLVALHGGAVSAESPGPGRGATFTVRLPLAEGAPAAARQAPAPGGPRRILVVDDNADAAEMLKDYLESLGHAVDVAGDGEAALARAAAFAPEVVLCDIGLPGEKDGYAVARALRADPAHAGVRLVAVTGYADQAHRRAAFDAGFDAHLAKPADLDTLVRLLHA